MTEHVVINRVKGRRIERGCESECTESSAERNRTLSEMENTYQQQDSQHNIIRRENSKSSAPIEMAKCMGRISQSEEDASNQEARNCKE
jgi:hypothetical protein